jgi:hypothetical protein
MMMKKKNEKVKQSDFWLFRNDSQRGVVAVDDANNKTRTEIKIYIQHKNTRTREVKIFTKNARREVEFEYIGGMTLCT